MITLDGDILVLDRAHDGDDILPILLPGKGGRPGAWYIDIGIAEQTVLHYLIDAEILAETFPIRYLTRTGDAFDAEAEIEELISDEAGDRCRLHGMGAPPAGFMGDAPQVA